MLSVVGWRHQSPPSRSRPSPPFCPAPTSLSLSRIAEMSMQRYLTYNTAQGVQSMEGPGVEWSGAEWSGVEWKGGGGV